MSPCSFTWCVYTGVWRVLFNAMVWKKCEGWSWEPSGLFWNRWDVSLQPVSWKSKVSMGGYGLWSGGFRARSFSRTLYGRRHQDDHHWGRVSVWFKSEKCSCDHCTACDHRVARLAAQWYWCSFDIVHFPCNECVWEYIHLQIIARGHAVA